MRVVFLGNDPWSVPSLEALAADPEGHVVSVITNPPRPAGRGSRLTPTAVALAARRLGLRVDEVEGVRTGAGSVAIRAAAPDLLVVVAYGELLSPETLAAPRLGAINVHFSLLPRWRGAAPVQHALLAGDERTGVTIMLMDAGLDTGPILATRAMAIETDDDAGSLGARLASDGAALLAATVSLYVTGERTPLAQPSEGATTAPKFTAADREIDWRVEADQVCGRVRALAPDPGARTRSGEDHLKLLQVEAAEVEPEVPASEPGTVVSVDNRGPIVAAGSGFVRVLRLAPAGRKRMSGADWARGARIQPGDHLG